MPRTARKKQEGAVYHVMARSISEVQLFKNDEDKKKYLLIVSDCKEVFNFIIYAYCLMDNHVHLIIYSNGADISKIMHYINFKYASYYNRIHKRHGHLFQDRFKSKIVTDDRYLVALSAYIHNNPVDIQGYENNPENYYYSSLAIYLGLRKDELNIIDKDYILSILDKNKNRAKERYVGLIMKSKVISAENIAKENVEFSEEKSEYRSERIILIRNFKIEDILKYVADKFNIEKSQIHMKYQRDIVPVRGILTLLLRNLCNVSCKDICNIFGNITSSRVSKLSSIGMKLMNNDDIYKNVVNDFLECYC